jgi:VWFA-related protein
MKRRRLLALIAAPAALLFGQVPPTIRTETRVVQIDVEVRDQHGLPVAGLTRDDFTVTDGGKRRAISIFSVEGEASTQRVPSSDSLPPNVFSNQSGTARPVPHATVILLDAINNYWDDFAAARLRLLDTIGKLRRDERIAVYAATTRPAGVVIVQNFTADRALLRRTIQAYPPPPIDPAPGMIAAPRGSAIEEESRRRIALMDTMSAFRLLSAHLGKLPGRKSLLWLTSGLPPKELREMPDLFEKAAAALNEANVAVHVLDDDGIGDPHRRWGRQAFWNLRDLADRTGGKAYLGRNDLDDMLAEAIERPRIAYTLGFYLPDEERDERFHPLAVRVARRGLELSYRKGYYAGVVAPPSAPRKREPLENALLDPQEATGIAISAEVAQTPATPRANLHIAMRLGAAQLSFREQAGGLFGAVEQMFLETNAAGGVVAKVTTSKDLRVSPRTLEQFQREGLPLVQDVGLMEDAVRLLIVVRDTASGRTGTLSVPLIEERP